MPAENNYTYIKGGYQEVYSWLAVWSLPTRTFLLMDFVRAAIAARERLPLFANLLNADEKSYLQSSADANKSPEITKKICIILNSSTLPFKRVLTSPPTFIIDA